MDPFALRRERLAATLREEALDAFLVNSPVNVRYLTGFTGESSPLIVGRERSLLVSDPRFTEQIAEECPGLDTHIRTPSQTITFAEAEALRKLGFSSVGFESHQMTVVEYEALRHELPAVQWKGAADRVEKLRIIKDDSEIAQIREAIDVAERAFTVFCSLLRPDDTERELCDALDGYIRRAGGHGTAFPTIVAAGSRASLAHAPPTARTVGKADLLLVDWGVSGAAYKSDLTRVLDTRRSGTFTGKNGRSGGLLEEIHTIVTRAQRKAIEAVRPGVTAAAIDTVARQEIADAGYGDYFGHGLGHGLGLQVHEAPFFRPTTQTVLQPGMVFTVEPGIYLPGWGGVRIEDDVLVTPDGYEVLSHLPREATPIFAGRSFH